MPRYSACWLDAPTRSQVRGVVTTDKAQLVFIDTPGIFAPKRRLDRAMVTTAWGGAKDADLIMLLIDSERGLRGDADAILEGRANATNEVVEMVKAGGDDFVEVSEQA